jgi:hypothetical protein
MRVQSAALRVSAGVWTLLPLALASRLPAVRSNMSSSEQDRQHHLHSPAAHR